MKLNLVEMLSRIVILISSFKTQKLETLNFHLNLEKIIFPKRQ